ncbi:MAG: hypothetical protein WC441_03050 [Patescibacteria group bacterium]
MKRLIAFSLVADFCLIILFFLLTRWVFSAAAFWIINLLLFCLVLFFEYDGDKAYRLVLIPTLLPVISFSGLDFVNWFIGSPMIAWPWLYISTLVAGALVCRLFNHFVLEDAYFRELKYSSGINRFKLIALAATNLLLVSLAIMVIIDHYE